MAQVTSVQMRFLDLFFERVAGEPRIRSYCGLEGFITGMTFGPVCVEMAVWYPRLFGSLMDVEWESAEQSRMFRDLIESTLMAVRERGHSSKAIFQPYPCQPRSDHLMTESECFAGISQWCLGFSKAADELEEQWSLSSVKGHLDNIIDFANDPARKTYPVGNYEEARKWLSWEVTGLIKHWRAQGNRGSIQNPERKVTRPASAPGRNDPCSCGSGRKYKKCCLPV
jgi:uncharacterized protein